MFVLYERRAKPLMCCGVHSSQRYRFSVNLIVPEGLDTPNNMYYI